MEEQNLRDDTPKTEKNKFFTKKTLKKAEITFLIIAAAILFFFLLFRIDQLSSFVSYIIGILTPVLYGIAIAYLLNPLVERLKRFFIKILGKKIKKESMLKGLSKGLSITLAMLFTISLVTVLLILILPELYNSIAGLVTSLPEQVEGVITWFKEEVAASSGWAVTVQGYLEDILKYLQDWLTTSLLPTMNNMLSYVTSGIIGIISLIVNLFIGLVVAVYVLIEKDIFTGQAKKLLYTLCKPQRANAIIDTARHGDKIFGGFLSGKILDSLIVGILAFIVLSIMKMPYTLLISVIVGVTNIIPFFGPFIGAIPSAFLILLVDPVQCFWFVVFIIILQQIDGNIIGPKILGTTTGISEFWVTFALLLFGGLFGFIGMIIGVPLFAVIYYICKNLVNKKIVKRGLPVSSELYRNVDRIDEETLAFIPLPETEEKKKSRREKRKKKK